MQLGCTRLALTLNCISESLVTFVVRTSVTRYTIHKELACFYSPALKVAFNGNFNERNKQAYKLEDTDQDTFLFLRHWLYCQSFPEFLTEEQKCLIIDQSLSSGENDARLTAGRNVDKLSSALVRLWVLAGMLLVPTLQNMVIDALRAMREELWHVAYHTLDHFYHNTIEDRACAGS
jgi:hypothetical protein